MTHNSKSKSSKFVVDVHQHWAPLEALKGNPTVSRVTDNAFRVDIKGISSLMYQPYYDIDLADKVNSEAGVDKRILVPSMVVAVLAAGGMPVLEASKRVHDATAELISTRPWLASFATVDPFDPASLVEAERAIKDLGFKGLFLESSWMGRWYDSEEVYPYFEFAQANRYPIYMHPPQLPYGYQIMNKWRLEEVVGRPADTSMSVARLICSGLLDRFPDIQIVLAHMGGDVIPILGRLDFGHRLGYEGLPADQHAHNKLLPSEYMRRNFYADTMGFNLAQLTAAVTVFGTDRVMFGTDYNAVPLSPTEHMDLVNRLGVTESQREDIFWRNANRLFRLSLAETGA